MLVKVHTVYVDAYLQGRYWVQLTLIAVVQNKMCTKPIKRVEVDVKVTPQNASGGTEGGVEL